MPHKPQETPVPFNDLVAEYLDHFTKGDFTDAHYRISKKHGHEMAQRVSWFCLNTELTKRIGGKIVLVKKEPANVNTN